MTLRAHIAVLTGVLFANSLLAASDDVPVLTVCEVLSNLEHYEGRTVIIVGRSTGTFEGSGLEEDCGMKVVRAEHEFRATISIAYSTGDFAPPPELPKGFRWDKNTLQQKLSLVERTTRLRTHKHEDSDEWLAVFGRLETDLSRKVNIGNGHYGYASGFGHLSGSPAQLIFPADGTLRLK
jgi:hypothetical protein